MGTLPEELVNAGGNRPFPNSAKGLRTLKSPF
jgi:hypothetical protein